MAERALKHNKFTYGTPAVSNEETKENEEGNADGDDDGIQEDLENKEIPDDDLGDIERGKNEIKNAAEDDE